MDLFLGLAGLASGVALTHLGMTRKHRDTRDDVARLTAKDEKFITGEARHIQASLAREARDISLLVAVSASIVNTLATGQRAELRSSIAAYLPPQPLILPAAIELVARMGLDANKTVQNLVGYYALVNFARTATLVYADKLEGSSKGVDLETLCEAWRAAAKQSIGVLTHLDADSGRSEFGTRDHVASQRLIELLRSVVLGRAPCVRLDGAVIVPGWVERRAHVRREVAIPVELAVNGANYKMIVRDISPHGVGLEGEVSAKPGDRVNIALDGGAKINGVAVWNRDGRLGVKLDKLPPTAIADD